MGVSSVVGAGRAHLTREFRAVLAGQAVSALGDAITLTATPLLVLALTGSGAWMGVVGALQFLPDLLLSLAAGVLADRVDRRRLVVAADTGRAVLTMLVPIAHWTGLPTLGVLVAVTFPVNALRVVSDAGLSSALPQLAGRDDLARANSYMEATLSVPYIVGPAIAGGLVASIGAPSTLAIDAATFALSAASFLAVRRTLRAERPAQMPTWMTDLRDGLRFIRGEPLVRTVIGFWVLTALVTTPLIATLSYYLTIDRGLGVEVFGFVGSAWSIGYLGGSLLAGRLPDRRLGVRLVAAGVAIGLLIVAIAAARSTVVYYAAAALIGAALAVVVVTASTLRASLTPDALMGRVGSTSRTLSLGLQPIALLGAGALIELSDGRAALIVLGTAAAAGSLLFAPLRSFREATYAPAGQPST
jgi:ENTS family enterobactin (siderophore) exporter